MKRIASAVPATLAAVLLLVFVAILFAQPGPATSGAGSQPGHFIKLIQDSGDADASNASGGDGEGSTASQVSQELQSQSKLTLTSEQSDGALQLVRRDGTVGEFCPLKHTDVNAEISGFLARVTVTQDFVNPSSEPVEAIYVFPLPQNAAVDDMMLQVGYRTIRGLIKRREEAQRIYRQARDAGHTAALLDQERPNIFTQSVANIAPGASVKVVISYVERLNYEAGVYSFVYPMVVGPRYIPGQPTGQGGGGWSPDTTQVPDASRITPPVAGVHYGKKGTRAGHDISISVRLDAGVPVERLRSQTHDLDVENLNSHAARVTLRKENVIPNRDFVLTYDVSGGRIEDALLVHSRSGSYREAQGGGGAMRGNDGFFTFLLQPPDRVNDEDASPRQLIFVLDTSGSMMGYPIETAKKTMRKAIENMRGQDTFNLITFSGDTHVLFPQPVLASSSNIREAVRFLDGQRGGGGTEMMKAIRIALGDDGSGVSDCGPQNDGDGDGDCVEPAIRSRIGGQPLRIVCFMTDGYVGNDMEIIGEVQKHADARVFSFGIGSSVNRFLLDKMAEAGRGEVEYVLRAEDAGPAAARFYERIHTPVLTDISIDWGGLPVHDVMPARPLDLFTAKPLALTGRYSGASSGIIRLRGKRAGRPFERAIRVELPSDEPHNQALAGLWARTRIDQLMSEDWNGIQQGNPKTEVREQITQLGLDYRLMTQFTSFVAVEEQTVVEGGRRRTIQVPVEMPHHVSREGVFGEEKQDAVSKTLFATSPMPNSQVNQAAAVDRGIAGGNAGGVLGGTLSARQAYEAPRSSDATRRENDRLKIKDEAEKNKKALSDALAAKLHPSLLAAYECWKKGSSQCDGVQKGTVKVQVWLTAASPELLARVRAAGLAMAESNALAASGAYLGTIALEKLPELAKLEGVRLIALQK